MLLDWSLKVNKTIYLVILMLIYISITILYNKILYTETYFLHLLSDLIDNNSVQLQNRVLFIIKAKWYSLPIGCIFIIIKISLVALCLYLGCFFLTDQLYRFVTFFNITLKAEIIFVIYSVVRLLWYKFVYTPETVGEMQVMPLSLMYFFDPEIIDPWLIYPLNTINVFEGIYFVMLSVLTTVAIKTKFTKAFELVFVSYGAGLLLMMVIQMFLILNNT